MDEHKINRWVSYRQLLHNDAAATGGYSVPRDKASLTGRILELASWMSQAEMAEARKRFSRWVGTKRLDETATAAAVRGGFGGTGV